MNDIKRVKERFPTELIGEKLKESAVSVLPIVIIVAILCLAVTPVSPAFLLAFLVGTLMIIIGMGMFTIGAESAMTVIGNRIGSSLTKSKKLWLILLVSFILGLAVTVSEPDLQVLAQTVPHIDNMVLIVTVGVGVGSFLMICMLRIFLGIKLKWLLIAFYGIVFLLAAFSDPDYLSIAFDAGGNPLTDAFGIVATVAMMSLPVTAIAGFGLLDNN